MGKIKVSMHKPLKEQLVRALPEYLTNEIEDIKRFVEKSDISAEEFFSDFWLRFERVFRESVNNCSPDEEYHYFKDRYSSRWYFCKKFMFAFVHINKNATTSLRSIIVRNDIGHEVSENGGITGLGNEIVARNRCFFAEKPTIAEGVIKFAVWRDPYERLKSSLKSGNYSIERVMSLINTYIRGDIYMKRDVCAEPHLRRQSDYYTPDDVDYIVKIEDLDDFLELVVKVPKEEITHSNKSPNKLLHSFFAIRDNEKEFFDKYYEPDYKLIESNKVWQNPRRKQ